MGEATFPKSVSNATVAPSSDATIEPLPDPEKSQDLEASEDRLPDADDDDSKYPGARIVIPILGALYITMFLVALVSFPAWCHSCLHQPHLAGDFNNLLLGQNHYCNCNPANHRRLPLHRRRGVVRQFLYARGLRPPARVRQNLHLLLPQSRSSGRNCYLRGRFCAMRRGPVVDRLHRRTGHCRLWECGDLYRYHHQYCPYHSFA